MPKLTIDGIEVEVPAGASVLQACEQLGIEVPRFCYHDRLSVPANCRMCLVEMERAPKPIASCAMPCGEGMVIKTDTDRVRKARRGVMEMLLINHPLDCPICDQGGECDLQDQAVAYGMDRGRYTEMKRAVTDKNLGPLIKTSMTRCIHCTRCIRFSNEIAGVPELGATGRGEHMEIGPYIEASITSELSGNLVDVCPVGALTSGPYAYTTRPWELRKTETIDVLDAVGSNIRIDVRGREVMRVQPRLNEDVNEDWINDKTRYSYDGLKRQRLDRPYVRGEDGKLKPVEWDVALAVVAERLKATPADAVAALAGDLVDLESVYALKDLMTRLGVTNLDCRQDGALFDTAAPAGYIFNTGIAGIEQADAVLLVGTNPRVEATMINARLRKRWLRGGCRIGVVGEKVDLTYRSHHLGAGAQTLMEIAEGRHEFCQHLEKAERPMIVLGAGLFRRADGAVLQGLGRQIAERFGMIRDDWNGFNVLQLAAGRTGALMAGFLPGQGGRDTAGILRGCRDGSIKTVFLLGADEIEGTEFGEAFVVYQGHHGDRGAHRADVILPGAAYTEKSALYVNTEGRVQAGKAGSFPPGEAREDWKILRALSAHVGSVLPYDTQMALRSALAGAHPHFATRDEVLVAEWTGFGAAGSVDATPFAAAVDNFYMTDAITRASATMARCVEELTPRIEAGATGTHG